MQSNEVVYFERTSNPDMANINNSLNEELYLQSCPFGVLMLNVYHASIDNGSMTVFGFSPKRKLGMTATFKVENIITVISHDEIVRVVTGRGVDGISVSNGHCCVRYEEPAMMIYALPGCVELLSDPIEI